MGQEILYCSHCQKQLRSQDFEKGLAFRIDGRACCKSCAPEGTKSQSSVALQALPKPSDAQGDHSPPRSSTTRMPAPSLSGSSSRRVIDTRLIGQGDSSGSLGVIAILGAVGVVLLIGLIAVVTRSGGVHVEPGAARRTQDPQPVPPDAPPSYASAMSEARSKREPPGPSPAESDSLSQARAYVRSNPIDFVGQINLYERALEDLKGKPKQGEAASELAALKKSIREQIATELAALDSQIEESLGKELFSRAIERLLDVRIHLSHPDWMKGVDERIAGVQRKAQALFPSVKDAAVAAGRKGAQEDVRSAQERVARWGLEPFSGELAKALSESTPASSPEALAYQKCWESAARLARAGDLAAALEELKRGAGPLKEGGLKNEASEDQALLAQASVLLKEAAGIPPKWPRGQSVSLDFIDPSGIPVRFEGSVLRIDPYRVELRASTENRSVVVPFGEIRATTLVRLAKAARSKLSTVETRALAAVSLWEGDPDLARTLLAGTEASLPEKYWSQARSVVELAARGGGSEPSRERDARSLFYTAEPSFDDIESMAEGAQTAARLLKEFSDTAFVSRNRALISFRSQQAKEVFLFPEEMRAQGGFVLSRNPKTESCYTGESDLELSRLHERFVEVAFSVLPATEYRMWVYVGACCAETFAFSYQATELAGAPSKDAKDAVPMEPGGAASMPVKISLLSLKKTHASHMGPKNPARWEWIQIPLPKFASPGRKVVRLFSNQKGFSLAYAFVSAQRTSPPGDTDPRTFERLRAESPGGRPLVRLTPATTPRVVIADFETDPKGWRFIGGWEFPGAKGSLTLDTSQAHGGKRSYRLDADFTGGGRYVGTWFDFKVMKDPDFKEIHLWVKAGALKGLGIRIGDSTGQCHQNWIPLLPTEEWQEVVLKFADLAGREHWGGANDGQLHLPLGGFGINLGTNEIATPGAKTASLWIDDVEGVPAHERLLMSVGSIQDPSFENQNQGDGKRLVSPWLYEGPVDSGCDGNNGRGGSKCGYIYDGNGSAARSDIVQTISVAPHTSYTLSCYIQTGEAFPAQGSVGARAPGGTILASQAFGLSKDYTQLSVTFSSGTNTSVVIFAGFTSVAGKGGAWIHVDDWRLVTASVK